MSTTLSSLMNSSVVHLLCKWTHAKGASIVLQRSGLFQLREHPCWESELPSLFRPINLPFLTPFLFTHLWVDIWSALVFAAAATAAVNAAFCLPGFSVAVPGRGMLGHALTLGWTFWRSALCVLCKSALSLWRQLCVKRFWLFCILKIFGIFCFSDNIHPNHREVASSAFDSHFPTK